MSNDNDLHDIIRRVRDERTRWDAILELKLNTTVDWVDPLIAYLSDSEWVIRWCCAEKLGDMQDSRAVLPLIQALSDEDGHVRKNATNALTRFGSEIIVELIPFLKHQSMLVRRNVHIIIQKSGQDALPILEKAVHKKSWIVANNIAHAIWIIGGTQAEVTLIRLLHYSYIQKTLIILLGQMDSRLSIPYLVQLFEKSQLKRPILHTINHIGADIVIPEIVHLLSSKKEKIMKGAYATLKKIGEKAYPFLVDALKDEEAAHKAIVQLLMIGDISPFSAQLKSYATEFPYLSDSLGPLLAKLRHTGSE